MAPTIFKNGSCNSCKAKKMSTTRKAMAPATPQKIPLLRCSGGSFRHAKAITTALSPPSKMSMAMICSTLIKNAAFKKSMKEPVEEKGGAQLLVEGTTPAVTPLSTTPMATPLATSVPISSADLACPPQACEM